jgi:hydroxyquinol 1,2-dioxygenase
VREVRPTQDEWSGAIAFLTETGHMCSGGRQEFILLSDTLGVSMLVDAITHAPSPNVTESTVVGPFYVSAPPEFRLGADISGSLAAEPLFVSGTVRTPEGAAITDAIVDVWHSDDEGFYDVQKASEFTARGRFHVDSDGRVHFWSITPAPYPIPHDGPVGRMLQVQGRHPWRPAHMHFRIESRGYEALVTHLFVAGSPHLDSDAVFGVKDSLIREFERCSAGKGPNGRMMDRDYYRLQYDFHLKPTTAPVA